jgi:hypothetical protein
MLTWITNQVIKAVVQPNSRSPARWSKDGEQFTQGQTPIRPGSIKGATSPALDCTWTQLQKNCPFVCPTAGPYRPSPTKDKMWSLHRLNTVAEDEKGIVIGSYRQRGDVANGPASQMAPFARAPPKEYQFVFSTVRRNHQLRQRLHCSAASSAVGVRPALRV